MSDKNMENSKMKDSLKEQLHKYQQEQKQIQDKPEHDPEDKQRLEYLKNEIAWIQNYLMKYGLEEQLQKYKNEQKQIQDKHGHNQEDKQRLDSLKKEIEWNQHHLDFYNKKIKNFGQCANNPYCLSFDWWNHLLISVDIGWYWLRSVHIGSYRFISINKIITQENQLKIT